MLCETHLHDMCPCAGWWACTQRWGINLLGMSCSNRQRGPRYVVSDAKRLSPRIVAFVCFVIVFGCAVTKENHMGRLYVAEAYELWKLRDLKKATMDLEQSLACGQCGFAGVLCLCVSTSDQTPRSGNWNRPMIVLFKWSDAWFWISQLSKFRALPVQFVACPCACARVCV